MIKADFLRALKIEWEMYRGLCENKKILSIYFGGGTPYLLGVEGIQEILSWIQDSPTEITLEANPEDIELHCLQELRSIGVNRISLGVQSFDDSLLKTLGRSHSSEKAQKAIFDAHRANFDNITIDLMYDLPDQTLASWKHTLEITTQLPIQHLSLYNLTFEPQTIFFKKKPTLSPRLPSSEDSTNMLLQAVEWLEHYGWYRYEISAFAKPGYRSLHNTGYWTGRPFLGFGPSAFSYWNGKRYRNICHMKRYIECLMKHESPIDFEETLSSLKSLHERLAIHLRLTEGVKMQDYPVNPDVYQCLIDKGWLEIDDDYAKLTSQGQLFYDAVAEDIILV